MTNPRHAQARTGSVGRWLQWTGLGLAVLLFSAAATWLVCGQRAIPTPVVPVVGASPTRDSVIRGGLLYQVHCAKCHGDEGHGDGPSAAGLNPAPRDFASSVWKFGSSASAIHRVVADGVRGTGMPAYSNAFTATDLEAVVAFVQTLAPAEAGPEPMPARLATLLKDAAFTSADELRPAPPIDVRAADGARHSLETLHGRPVLLAFWGVDCPHCLKHFLALERLAGAQRDRGLVVLPICVDESDAVEAQAAARRHVAVLSVYADPSALTARRYDVQVLPTTVLIDAQGRLLGRAEGALDWSAPALADLLNQVLGPP